MKKGLKEGLISQWYARQVRTYDLLLRKQTLYPAELRAQKMVHPWAFRALRQICGCFEKSLHPPRN